MIFSRIPTYNNFCGPLLLHRNLQPHQFGLSYLSPPIDYGEHMGHQDLINSAAHRASRQANHQTTLTAFHNSFHLLNIISPLAWPFRMLYLYPCITPSTNLGQRKLFAGCETGFEGDAGGLRMWITRMTIVESREV